MSALGGKAAVRPVRMTAQPNTGHSEVLSRSDLNVSQRPGAVGVTICQVAPEFRLIRKAQNANPAGTTKPTHDTSIGTA